MRSPAEFVRPQSFRAQITVLSDHLAEHVGCGFGGPVFSLGGHVKLPIAITTEARLANQNDPIAKVLA